MHNHSNEHGYTMIETIMYIGLLIVLTASFASGISHVFYRYKIGRINQQLLELKKDIVAYTATWESYGERVGDDGNTSNKHILTKEQMSKDKAFAIDMRNGIHALGGELDIGSAINYPGANEDDKNNEYMFYITFKTISFSACVEILTQGQFYGDGADLDTLIINDDTRWKYKYSHFNTSDSFTSDNILTFTSSATGKATGISLSITDATKACTEENDNYITWIFS